MVKKRPLCPQRLRKIPAQFSWIDQRLVRDKHIGRVSHPGLALYLFLLTVADADGLSYYSDTSIAGLIRIECDSLQRARQELLAANLIAYQKPLYQVLSLDPPRQNCPHPVSIGTILSQLTGARQP